MMEYVKFGLKVAVAMAIINRISFARSIVNSDTTII